ncbi:putative odorant receptor 83c [Sabethes cyaneus]|uniref:putative odorant receptor 83c n=1 Tax=Sabethes cyaneus TaxID=53552 RepID=UPI00237E9305|nr:putative odorant receptor 83c [Sabethes cyaneus]
MGKPTNNVAKQKFHQIFRNLRLVSDAIGLDVLVPNYRISGRTVFLCLIVTNATFTTLYGCWRQRSDFVKLLESVPFMMMVVQAIHKVILRISRPEPYRALYELSCSIFEMLNENEANGIVMQGSLRLGCILQRMLQILYAGVIFILVVVAIGLYLIFDVKFLAMPMYFPGLDENTDLGFLILITMHIVMLMVAICGYLTIDCHFLAMVIPFAGYVDGFQNEIIQLNLLLKQHKSNEVTISNKLKRICRLHQMLIEYGSMLEDHYTICHLVKIGSIVIGLICAAFITLAYSFMRTKFVPALLAAQLTQYCAMGTIITTKNDQLIKDLYNMDWYLLTNSEAKLLVLMLQRAQNAPQ